MLPVDPALQQTFAENVWLHFFQMGHSSSTSARPTTILVRGEGSRVWDQDDVDDWVKEARPHVWAAFKGTGPVLLNPLPEGDPRDLLDVDDFAEVWGIATRGEPMPSACARPIAFCTMSRFASRSGAMLIAASVMSSGFG